MNHDHVAWGPPPVPGEHRPALNIVSAPPSGHLDFVLLTPQIHGVDTHWIDGRTTPCTRGNGCKCEIMEMGSRWKGWFGGVSCQSRRLCLVELTALAWLNLSSKLSQSQRDSLRGFVLRLSRCRRTKSGKVIAELVRPDPVAEDLLPPPPDVQFELARIWKAKR